MRKAIAYYRVSTSKQGEEGYSLEAQQKVVHDFASFHGYELIDECREIESGKINKRPVLQQALKECKKQKATLLIAKLDRLSRRAGFIINLYESKVDFKAVDYPEVPKAQLYLMAVFAEWERDEISRRTKAGMAVKKSQGAVFGANMRNALSKKNKQAADEFALKLKPDIEAMKQNGIVTVRKIAKELTRKRIKTFSGKAKWHIKSVHNLLQRIEAMTNEENKVGDENALLQNLNT